MTSRVHIEETRSHLPGRPAHFREVYRTGFAYVWHVARRLGVPETDLEDVVQDVFEVVHRRMDDFDSSRRLKPWLAGIAVRRALKHLEKGRKHVVPHEPVDVPEDRASPEEETQDLETRALLANALSMLSADRRVAFVLHDIEEYTAPEIAEMLELPLNTVYSRLRRARSDLVVVVTRMQKGADQ